MLTECYMHVFVYVHKHTKYWQVESLQNANIIVKNYFLKIVNFSLSSVIICEM